jgi:WxcM-like, C-terminal
MTHATLDDIREIIFPLHPSAEASLSVYEYPTHVPFQIARVFVVNATQACERGAHAHKNCTQLLICLKGALTLTIKDGLQTKNIRMDSAKTGILIPASLWAEQTYDSDSTLMVLTDMPYDESDYIRDYKNYLSYRGVK